MDSENVYIAAMNYAMLLTGHGLDPEEELKRHDWLAAQYRCEMWRWNRRRNWRFRELMDGALFHEEEARKLRRGRMR